MDEHFREPWEMFFDEFKRGATHIPLRYRDWTVESDDLEALRRVIRQVRKATFDHLRYEQHWSEERARALIDRFTSGILIPWLRDGNATWGFLKEDLRNEWIFPTAGPGVHMDGDLSLGR